MNTASISGKNSINTTVNKRHNLSCKYYDCKNCVPYGADAGDTCGVCGG